MFINTRLKNVLTILKKYLQYKILSAFLSTDRLKDVLMQYPEKGGMVLHQETIFCTLAFQRSTAHYCVFRGHEQMRGFLK